MQLLILFFVSKQFTSMWNITGTRIHLNTRGSEPWAQGSLIPGANYSAQVLLFPGARSL